MKGVKKAKIAQSNSQVSEGGIYTVKPGQDFIQDWVIQCAAVCSVQEDRTGEQALIRFLV